MASMRSIAVLTAVALLLAACGDVRESLGLGRNPPDEFAVIDRPPLSMPPDFSLRPPRPGAPRPQETDLTRRADDILFAGDTPADGAAPAAGAAAPADVSDAEKALLSQVGADKAMPDIRETINRESTQKVSESPHLVDHLLWWKKDEDNNVVVDAPAEAARLKDAKDKGEAPDQGATPIIEHEKSGWLGL